MIISILNQKGGTGKTTLSVNIAREYKLRGKSSLLVDSDSQGSALRWHEHSNGDMIDMTCLPVGTIDKDIIKFKNIYERIIIDGVPRISSVTIGAIKVSDLILIPVQPSPYDIWATEDLVRHVKDRIEMTNGQTKAAFIVSRKITGTNISKDIYEQLNEFDIPVFKSSTSQRVAYASTVQVGTTVVESISDSSLKHKEACLEVRSIVDEIEEFYHGAH